MSEASRPVLAPAAADALAESAVAVHQAGRLGEAERVYRQILAEYPDHPAACHFLGVLLHQNGSSDDGIRLVRRSLELRPEAGDWHNDLGNMLAATGRDAEAAAAFMAALQIQPNDALVWNNLGAVLRRGGQLDEACLAFENAVALAPDWEDPLHNLGDVQTALGRAAEAARSYCAAYVLRPGPEKPRQMLGIAYYTLGRIEDAARIYRLWLSEEPDNPIARHLLAACSGDDVPERAADAYLQAHFDACAETFEAKLVGSLAYRIPALIGRVLADLAIPAGSLRVLDAGCGTGLCGPQLAPYAKNLVGVDLSAKSLALAADKGVYDQLVHREIVDYLSGVAVRFDLVVAADTFIYFGRLEPFLRAAADRLAPGGLLIASIEESTLPGVACAIQPSGRYRHHRDYVAAALAAAGFELLSVAAVDVRIELGQPVPGLLLVARLRTSQRQ